MLTWTLSLPRVINFKFPLQPHHEYNITKNLVFHISRERWLLRPFVTVGECTFWTVFNPRRPTTNLRPLPRLLDCVRLPTSGFLCPSGFYPLPPSPLTPSPPPPPSSAHTPLPPSSAHTHPFPPPPYTHPTPHPPPPHTLTPPTDWFTAAQFIRHTRLLHFLTTGFVTHDTRDGYSGGHSNTYYKTMHKKRVEQYAILSNS